MKRKLQQLYIFWGEARAHWNYWLLAFGLLLLLLSYWLDIFYWMLLALLVARLLWNSYQRFRLLEVIRTRDLMQIPQMEGAWGSVFDALYRQKKRQERRMLFLTRYNNMLLETLDSGRSAIILMTPSGTMEWCNKVAEEILGIRRRSDRGQPLFHLLRSPQFRSLYESGGTHIIQVLSPVDPQKVLTAEIRYSHQSDYRVAVFREADELLNLEKKNARLLRSLGELFSNNDPSTLEGRVRVAGYLEGLSKHGSGIHEWEPNWTMDTLMKKLIESKQHFKDRITPHCHIRSIPRIHRRAVRLFLGILLDGAMTHFDKESGATAELYWERHYLTDTCLRLSLPIRQDISLKDKTPFLGITLVDYILSPLDVRFSSHTSASWLHLRYIFPPHALTDSKEGESTEQTSLEYLNT